MNLVPAVAAAEPRPRRTTARLSVALLCALACTLLVSASAWANPIVTEAAGANPVGATTATVAGTVNPNGSPLTSCQVHYSAGFSVDQTVNCATLPGGVEPVPVSANLVGLIPNKFHEFQIIASNADGTTTGAGSTFTTANLPAPTVTTGAATVGSSSATLTGTANPNGAEVTSCLFEWGFEAGAYGYTSSCDVSVGAGTAPVTVHGVVSGLTPGLTIHYRLVADSSGGHGVGADQAFTVGSGNGPGPGAAGPLTLPTSARVKAGTAALALKCASGGSSCRGTLTLSAKVKQGGKTKTIAVGKARVSIAAGGRATARVKLSRAAKAALKKAHRLRVTVKGIGRARTLTLKL